MRRMLMLAVPLLCSGACVNGLVYHHTVTPLTRNFNATPAGPTSGAGDTKHLQLSYVNVLWESNGIGDIAAKLGLQEIDYADLERLSILGVWTQEWVHVYGR